MAMQEATMYHIIICCVSETKDLPCYTNTNPHCHTKVFNLLCVKLGFLPNYALFFFLPGDNKIMESQEVPSFVPTKAFNLQ